MISLPAHRQWDSCYLVLKGSDIIVTSCFREVNDELDLRELFEQHLWTPSQLSSNTRIELFIKRRFKWDKIGSLTFEQLEFKKKTFNWGSKTRAKEPPWR